MTLALSDRVTELAEVFEPCVVPDATIEPAPVFNIVGTKKVTGRGISKFPVSLNQAVAKPVREPQGELDKLAD